MQLQELAHRAITIRAQYAAMERSRYGRSWTNEEIMLGFVGDVGDLAKLVMAQEGIRAIPDAKAKLAHELADCLWSVLVLADHYQIDLEQAFLHTMADIEDSLRAQSKASTE
ncbi:MAG: nucleotide pyrophosphohydrolase [Caldilinea sp. CFX5]|nr:nucleotide pyrophosphohydrolase [Caldilinea sp. CFX5]